MRVGLNATCFDFRPSGANQRFFNIYGALIRQRTDIEFLVYEPADVPVATRFGGAPNVVAIPTPLPSVGRLARVRAGLGFWRKRLRVDRLDLFEAFHLPLVVAPDCPTLFTIHDLRPLLPGQSWASRRLAAAVTRHAFARAARVITVSDVMKREILSFRPATRVTTVHNGVDTTAFEPWSGDGPGADMPARFALTVGHLELRKNLTLLVDAIAELKVRGLERSLVICGNDAGDQARIGARIAERGVGDLVRIVNGASDSAVRALYAACRLLVFPSRYEGFGIPLLEAMAAGRPIAASDLPVFREIMDGEGAFFSADDPAGAADAIERMWSDEAERARMVAFGHQRVRAFDFARLAREISAIYAELGPRR
ncbi:MAG: glycosyltransferase family 4 protein [Janthinobacterium lividum]